MRALFRRPDFDIVKYEVILHFYGASGQLTGTIILLDIQVGRCTR